MNKISKEHLETIKEQQTKLNQILNQVGYLEAQKHGLLHEFAQVNKEVEDFKPVLEKEYGQVNINVDTGEYTSIEKEEVENA